MLQGTHTHIGFQHANYAEKRKEKKVSSTSQKLLLFAVQVFSEQQQARPLAILHRVPENESCRCPSPQQRTTTTVSRGSGSRYVLREKDRGEGVGAE